jgi:hypothetical protein
LKEIPDDHGYGDLSTAKGDDPRRNANDLLEYCITISSARILLQFLIFGEKHFRKKHEIYIRWATRAHVSWVLKIE